MGMAQALGVVFAEGQLTPSEWALAHEMVNQLKRTSEDHLLKMLLSSVAATL
jgi:hypothetical protein